MSLKNTFPARIDRRAFGELVPLVDHSQPGSEPQQCFGNEMPGAGAACDGFGVAQNQRSASGRIATVFAVVASVADHSL